MKGLERELLHYGFLTKPQVWVQFRPVQREGLGHFFSPRREAGRADIVNTNHSILPSCSRLIREVVVISGKAVASISLRWLAGWLAGWHILYMKNTRMLPLLPLNGRFSQMPARSVFVCGPLHRWM
jgi:hypothetical protein